VRYHAPSGRNLCPACAAGDVARLFELACEIGSMIIGVRSMRGRSSDLGEDIAAHLQDAQDRLSDAAADACTRAKDRAARGAP
jgi:hypothetical protein